MTNHTNQLPSETYRLAAKAWVEADSAARLLEETKTAVLAQRMKALGDMPSSHAEREVKASDEWMEFIRKMVEAKTAANLAKVKAEYYRMKFSEWTTQNANSRAEMRL